MPPLCHIARLALALLVASASLLASGSARAQADPPSPTPGEVTLHVAAPSSTPSNSHAPAPAETEAPAPQIHCGGAQASAGVVLVPGEPPGGYVRTGGEFANCATREIAPILRISEGVEGWFSPKGGGFAFPVGFMGGVKARAFVALAGFGFNIFTVDRVGGTVGGGIFSPRATARVGFHKGTFYVDVVGDVQRRWQWKLDDVTMFQAGVTVGVVTDLADRARASARR